MQPQQTYTDADIELSLSATVTALRPGEHEVDTAGGRIRYGACVLATGADPARPPLPGATHHEVHTLRSADSGRALRGAAGRSETAAVVGSGFIGCEAAVSLATQGIDVTMVAPEVLPQQSRLGAVVGHHILSWLHEAGVRTELSAAVTAITEGHTLHIADGRTVTVDLILLATGIRPRSALAREAGLAVEHDRVRTDAALRTTAPHIYAAGDVAFADNAGAGRPLLVEHWGEALTMGELAGRGAAGSPGTWSNPPGFWTVLGTRTLKYAAWGDGFDDTRVQRNTDGGFTVWYGSGGTVVGVLSYQADADYERGGKLIERGARLPGE